LNVLAKTKEAQPKFVGTRLKLEPIPYNATKPYASYDERKVKALQGFFSKFAAGARWRNLGMSTPHRPKERFLASSLSESARTKIVRPPHFQTQK
jgi:hypothetical protein